MSDNTKIEWADSTWQVSGGCDRVSKGCEHCYAERLVGTRQRHLDSRKNLTVLRGDGQPHWTGEINLYPENLDQPIRWKNPRRIFVNSLSDLFHKDVPFSFVDQVFAVMALCPQHTFQVLTKRPERMRDYFMTAAAPDGRRSGNIAMAKIDVLDRFVDSTTDEGFTKRLRRREAISDASHKPLFTWPLPNVWLGTSVEDQDAADKRIPELLQCPAAVRFLSVEPLLGPVDLFHYDEDAGALRGPGIIISGGMTASTPDSAQEGYDDSYPGIDWVIVGGESGPGARPCDVQWVRDIISQCQEAHVPIFVKQLGANIRAQRTFGCLTGANNSGFITNKGAWYGDGDYLYFQLHTPKGGDMAEWPEDLRVREFPEVSDAN